MKKVAAKTCAVLAIILLLTGIAWPASAGVGGENQASYRFAVIPYYTPEKIWTLFSPFIDYLNKTTHLPWKLQLYHNHEEFVRDLCNGQISAALAGPVPLARAFNTCGARPFLVALSRSGEPTYHSVLATSDPGIKSLAALKGQKVGFFRGSTAAHIVPVTMLKEKGVRLADIHPVFLESQDRIMSALLAGELVAAGMKDSLFQKLGKDRLKVVETSGPLPNFALCAAPSLPEKVRTRLVSSLIKLNPARNPRDAETAKNWDDEIKNGFVEPGDRYLAQVINLYSSYWEVINEPQ